MKKVFTRSAASGTILLLIILFALASCSSSRKSIGVEEGWELLSESKVNFVRDKDEIRINSHNQFTAIRFKVEDREVRINDVKIYFDNGDKLEPNIDEVILADQYSRIIELAKDGRYIDRIEFKYRTTGNVLKGRANVILFGKRYYPGY